MEQYIIDNQLLSEVIQFVQNNGKYVEACNLINRLTNLEELSMKNDPTYRKPGFIQDEPQKSKKK